MTLEEALEALRTLKVGEKPYYTQLAIEFECNRSTLSRHHRGVCGTRDAANDQQRHLNSQQELQLLKYIDRLCERGLPLTREMIRTFAGEISGKYIGKNWADRFLERHPSELLSRWASAMDSNRHAADSAHKYKLYFKLLKQKLQQYDVQPEHMYNMDKKGFLIGIMGKLKQIFSRRRYEAGELKSSRQDGNRE